MTKTQTVPENYAELYKFHYKLIKWHVVKAKISPDKVEDYAMELLTRAIDKGLIEQYDPEKGANFVTFLSSFCMIYLRHFSAQDRKNQERSYLSTDYRVGDNDETLILDLKGYAAPDLIQDAELRVAVESIRKQIKDTGDAKFLLFFDFVMLQVEEHGQTDSAELAELFGVTRSSIHNWRKRLREYFKEWM